MNRRTRRGDGRIPNDELLVMLSDVRRKIVSIEARATINGPLYNACDAARKAVDEIVYVVTGDREHLWSKQDH